MTLVLVAVLWLLVVPILLFPDGIGAAEKLKVDIAMYDSVSIDVLFLCGCKLATGMTVVWLVANGTSVRVVICTELELFELADDATSCVTVLVVIGQVLPLNGSSQTQ